MRGHRTILTASLFALALSASPVPAQEAKTPAPQGFWLTTPYPELSIRAGQTENIPLTLRNVGLPPQRASFEVTGLPDAWKWTLKGGAREVGAAIVPSNESEDLTLELTPPAGASGESVSLEVVARHGGGVVTLPMTVRLSDREIGGVTAEPELPALRGTARSTFSYKVKLTNEGTEDTLFNLAADLPEGFQARFKQGYGSEEITGVPVQAGQTANVTMEVVPARSAAAGRYPIRFHAASGDVTAGADLSLEVTGQPEIRIAGPQERLSGEAVAGEEATFAFTITNTGSAPLTDLELTSSPPSGWKVAFAPEKLDAIQPEQSREVNVTITPSERAVSGDYMVTLRANGGGLSESVQFRTTVRTATVWGIAGLGVIASAVLVLGLAIARYGRR